MPQKTVVVSPTSSDEVLLLGLDESATSTSTQKRNGKGGGGGGGISLRATMAMKQAQQTNLPLLTSRRRRRTFQRISSNNTRKLRPPARQSSNRNHKYENHEDDAEDDENMHPGLFHQQQTMTSNIELSAKHSLQHSSGSRLLGISSSKQFAVPNIILEDSSNDGDPPSDISNLDWLEPDEERNPVNEIDGLVKTEEQLRVAIHQTGRQATKISELRFHLRIFRERLCKVDHERQTLVETVEGLTLERKKLIEQLTLEKVACHFLSSSQAERIQELQGHSKMLSDEISDLQSRMRDEHLCTEELKNERDSLLEKLEIADTEWKAASEKCRLFKARQNKIAEEKVKLETESRRIASNSEKALEEVQAQHIIEVSALNARLSQLAEKAEHLEVELEKERGRVMEITDKARRPIPRNGPESDLQAAKDATMQTGGNESQKRKGIFPSISNRIAAFNTLFTSVERKSVISTEKNQQFELQELSSKFKERIRNLESEKEGHKDNVARIELQLQKQLELADRTKSDHSKQLMKLTEEFDSRLAQLNCEALEAISQLRHVLEQTWQQKSKLEQENARLQEQLHGLRTQRSDVVDQHIRLDEAGILENSQSLCTAKKDSALKANRSFLLEQANDYLTANHIEASEIQEQGADESVLIQGITQRVNECSNFEITEQIHNINVDLSENGKLAAKPHATIWCEQPEPSSFSEGSDDRDHKRGDGCSTHQTNGANAGIYFDLNERLSLEGHGNSDAVKALEAKLLQQINENVRLSERCDKMIEKEAEIRQEHYREIELLKLECEERVGQVLLVQARDLGNCTSSLSKNDQVPEGHNEPQEASSSEKCAVETGYAEIQVLLRELEILNEALETKSTQLAEQEAAAREKSRSFEDTVAKMQRKICRQDLEHVYLRNELERTMVDLMDVTMKFDQANEAIATVEKLTTDVKSLDADRLSVQEKMIDRDTLIAHLEAQNIKLQIEKHLFNHDRENSSLPLQLASFDKQIDSRDAEIRQWEVLVSELQIDLRKVEEDRSEKQRLLKIERQARKECEESLQTTKVLAKGFSDELDQTKMSFTLSQKKLEDENAILEKRLQEARSIIHELNCALEQSRRGQTGRQQARL